MSTEKTSFPLRGPSTVKGPFAYIEHLLFFTLLAYLFYSVQFAVPWLAGYDGYFHIKYSALLREKGFISSLPWLHFTIFRDYFRDHHLLFHYILVPFTTGDLIRGGKVAAFIFSLFPGIALFLILRAASVRLPMLWSVAAVLSSQPFLFRLSLLRVQSLALGLLLWIFLLHLKRKNTLIFLSSLLFVWLYDAFPLVLLVSGVYVISRWLVERERDLRPFIFALLGICAGLLLNPYFPENITSLFYNIYRTLLLEVRDIQLGVEWKPYDTWSLLGNSLPAFVLFFISILSMPLIRKVKAEEYALLVLSLVFLLLTFKSRRFIEYWPLFSSVTAALVIGRRVRTGYVLVLMLLLAPLLVANYTGVKDDLRKTRNPRMYERAALWLQENTEEGEVVFNADWDDFPFLFFYNHHNYYTVGLDPMYMYSYDRDLYLLYKAITRGKKADPGKMIREKFGARFVFLDRTHLELYRRLRKDPLASKVYEDKGSIIYRIGEAGDGMIRKYDNPRR